MPDAAPAPKLPLLDDAACQRALAILVDVGTAIALQLKPPTAGIPVAARATAFKQVAEAVRRTILLSRHIADAVPVRAQRDAKRTSARRQIIRAVEDDIARHARPADAQNLRVELLERLDAPEFVEDLDARPAAELIAELCRDLGLATMAGLRPPLRRTPDDIAILCAQAAAAPGSGLPQWLAAAQRQATDNDRHAAARPP